MARGLCIKITEYAIINETSKNYMALALVPPKYRKHEKEAFPKDEESKVQIDYRNGHIWSITLFLTEVSREDVDTHGVNEIKAKLRDWHQRKADYHLRHVRQIDEFKGVRQNDPTNDN